MTIPNTIPNCIDFIQLLNCRNWINRVQIVAFNTNSRNGFLNLFIYYCFFSTIFWFIFTKTSLKKDLIES
jgi:hypothetical protein